jgi:hypothetical protein
MDLTRRAEQGDEHQAATYDFLHAPAPQTNCIQQVV